MNMLIHISDLHVFIIYLIETDLGVYQMYVYSICSMHLLALHIFMHLLDVHIFYIYVSDFDV